MAEATRDPDRARRRGRAVMQPSIGDAALQAITVVPGRLLRLGAHDEAGRGFNRHLRCLGQVISNHLASCAGARLTHPHKLFLEVQLGL